MKKEKFEDNAALEKTDASGDEKNSLTAAIEKELSRRTFLKRAAVACTALMVLPKFAPLEALAQNAGGVNSAAVGGAIEQIAVRLKINGANYGMKLDPRVTILDLLRERLELTGTKKGCNHGQCGACTVIVNGERINSCLALAVAHDGDSITTVEGLANGEQLHAMQAAFIKHDGFQCGYCTSGQICSAVAMLNEAKRNTASHVTPDVKASQIALTDAEIRERMSGNLCRCGAYNGIVAAIREASGQSNNAASRA